MALIFLIKLLCMYDREYLIILRPLTLVLKFEQHDRYSAK